MSASDRPARPPMIDDPSGSARMPLTRMRRAIARSMSASASVPQFSIESDVRVGALGSLRAELRTAAVDFSYTDAFVAACAGAIADHPHINASFAEDAILQHSVVNIGLAIALDEGLIAPAILGADRLAVANLAAERRRLTAAAASGTLTGEELMSATFTVSNLGPYGVRRFRALVVPPQAAILAIGAVTDDALVSFTLSCDHRVIDGAPAARFLADVIARVEEPDWMRPSDPSEPTG